MLNFKLIFFFSVIQKQTHSQTNKQTDGRLNRKRSHSIHFNVRRDKTGSLSSRLETLFCFVAEPFVTSK